MISELGSRLLGIESLKKREAELESKIEEKEEELRYLGIAKEKALDTSGFSEYAHIFAVTGKPGNTFLTAAEGDTKQEARKNLEGRIPVSCKIHSHIGEINQMVEEKQNP